MESLSVEDFLRHVLHRELDAPCGSLQFMDNIWLGFFDHNYFNLHQRHSFYFDHIFILLLEELSFVCLTFGILKYIYSTT